MVFFPPPAVSEGAGEVFWANAFIAASLFTDSLTITRCGPAVGPSFQSKRYWPATSRVVADGPGLPLSGRNVIEPLGASPWAPETVPHSGNRATPPLPQPIPKAPTPRITQAAAKNPRRTAVFIRDKPRSDDKGLRRGHS